ncbi:hypothetical protein CVT25_007464 [Psilocybe cyanescens]|uniref:Peptidase A1 domain-containing protein n=1 Tax=Psilocybe cyanescens TaxID=93625 RepID=A0A409XVP6_PSICY|nr:hypothetical protein CVT25_007464 [Psilocybe cyanescens]
MLFKDLSATLIFVVAVIASPTVISRSPVTLALSRRVNTSSIHNLVRHDQSRAKELKISRAASSSDANSFALRKDAAANVQADNQAVIYVASINIGTPPTTCEFILLNEVQYGSGQFFGNEVFDAVTLTPDLIIPNQSMGSALLSQGFSGFDGILGSVGPTELTKGTLIPSTDAVIPTVVDNLYNQGLIPAYQLGIYFEATDSDQGVSNGELTFGGTDNSKYDSITYTPVTSVSPASRYWGIDQSLSYGNITLLAPGTSGIIDTGTTLILIATDAYHAYISATGAIFDNATNLLTITIAQYNNLQDMIFHIGGTDFRLIPDAQIWPRALNADIGGTADAIYMIVGDLGAFSGSGLDFINGFAFLERFYSVFDSGNKRVGIATTAVTTRIVNF